MFKSIICTTSGCYTIIDSSFQENIYSNPTSSFTNEEASIIRVYSKRKLNIPRNVAAYYKVIMNGRVTKYNDISRLKHYFFYKEQLDTFHPELEYGKKYYKCVLRNLGFRGKYE